MLAACSSKHTDTAGEGALSVTRLDRVVSTYPTLDDSRRAAVLDSVLTPMTAYMQVVYNDSAARADDATVMTWAQSMPVEMFTPAVDTVFRDLTAVEGAMSDAVARMRAKGLKTPVNNYATVVWGRPESIVLNDSVMLIALNHYLGADHEAYEHWPEYMRELKRPDMLVYDVVEAQLALAYPYQATGDKATLLSHMLYDGALAYAKTQLIDNADEWRAAGFAKRHYDDLVDNEAYMWNRLVTGKMLYQTDADLIDRLTAPAPASLPISAEAPGRAVRYTGLRIVQSYLRNNPGTTLADLLSPAFYADPATLQRAGYTPQQPK